MEGDVTPLGPAGGGLAAVGAVSLAGAPVAAASVANTAPLVGGCCWGGPADSASAAIIAVQLAAISAQAPQSQISSPARALPAEDSGTGRLAPEPIQTQKLQNELAACKTLGITKTAASGASCRLYASFVAALTPASDAAGPWRSAVRPLPSSSTAARIAVHCALQAAASAVPQRA